MSGVRRAKYERLLRWYPKTWRAEHGRVMLDTLDEHAAERGLARPSLAESWSIRSHGMGERATLRWSVGLAAVSLIAYIVAAAILFSDLFSIPGSGTVRTVLAVCVGPLTLAFALVTLLHRKGQLSAPASIWAAGFAVPAFAFAALAAEGWALGFEEADAGAERTWFATAALLFVALAWLSGSLALLAPVAAVVARELPVIIRWFLVIVVSALLSLVLGVMVMTGGQVLGGLAAAVMLLVAALANKRPAAQALTGTPTQSEMPAILARTPLAKRPELAGKLSRSTCIKVGMAALFSLVFGLGCAAFALTGSVWTSVIWASGVRDSTHAMNLGLAAGALVALPAIAGFGVLLRARFGPALGWSAVLVCAGLAVVAAVQFLGSEHRLQWPLTLAAALLVGLALAVPVARIMSTNPILRLLATVGLGLAGSLIGIYFVTAAAFVVPLAAAGLLLWVVLRLSKRRPVVMMAGRA